MMQNLHVGIKGRYRLEVRSSEEADPRQVLEFDNLITDAGLDFFGTLQSFQLYPGLGTGTSTPLPSDSSLTNQSSRITGTQTLTKTAAQTPPYKLTAVISRQSTQGQVAGTWTEIGMFRSTSPSANDMFSRALITDEFGNPTAITILPTEYLTVVYTLEYIIPPVDAVTVVGGRTFTTRALDVLSTNWLSEFNGSLYGFNQSTLMAYSGPMVPMTSSSISGSLGNSIQSPVASYVPGSFEIITSPTLDLTRGNGTIQTLRFAASSRGSGTTFQVGIDPPIVKDNTQLLTFQFKLSWGRAI